ncbi:DUF1810 domain-containing protein [Gluconacetobacter tumulisoli]|uniref:DUF1810 domain-containing protein n=1 Tax=Gluconacetobacter tumulisoli TaxID=1286189 RepID=A0A7W4K671_9PROT|nr:DUF1810 domain-containing protein [Gluconacetobacter tumulisoli]MBB2201091.1 DUF1810 domain-containing protein [Gluconacetobacter tumulisoli]
MTADPFDPDRFLAAQAPVMADVQRELSAGCKRTHWMWFVFPQLAGLGHSDMARRYALASLDDARAYLAHPVLGPRLRDCVTRVNQTTGRSAHEIFGSPDDRKFQSSMTLFHRAGPGEAAYGDALQRYYGGREDERTIALLAGNSPSA